MVASNLNSLKFFSNLEITLNEITVSVTYIIKQIIVIHLQDLNKIKNIHLRLDVQMEVI